MRDFSSSTFFGRMRMLSKYFEFEVIAYDYQRIGLQDKN
jgi:hypothetical protein